MSLTLRPQQLIDFLLKAIPAGLNTLVVGPPGIGKTEIGFQVAEMLNREVFVTHPGLEDPTTPAGLPWPNVDHTAATFLPFGVLKSVLDSKKPCLWIIDDLGQATTAVQAAYMPWFSARQVNGHRLPDHVSMLACSNRRTDRGGVSGILEPVKSRFATIVELMPWLEDFLKWGDSHGLLPEISGFLRFRPDQFNSFKPTADMTNGPCSRTWVGANNLLKLCLPPDIELPVLAGAVGEGTAGEFMAHVRVHRSLPNIDECLKHPDKAPILKEPSALYAMVSAMAYRANCKTFEAINLYATRLAENGKGEFGVLLLRDSIRRDPKVGSTKAWEKMASGKLGKIFVDSLTGG